MVTLESSVDTDSVVTLKLIGLARTRGTRLLLVFSISTVSHSVAYTAILNTWVQAALFVRLAGEGVRWASTITCK